MQVAITISISALSLVLIAPLSGPAAALIFGIYVAVNLIAPGILVWAQRYKKYAFFGTFYSLHWD